MQCKTVLRKLSSDLHLHLKYFIDSLQPWIFIIFIIYVSGSQEMQDCAGVLLNSKCVIKEAANGRDS